MVAFKVSKTNHNFNFANPQIEEQENMTRSSYLHFLSSLHRHTQHTDTHNTLPYNNTMSYRPVAQHSTDKL